MPILIMYLSCVGVVDLHLYSEFILICDGYVSTVQEDNMYMSLCRCEKVLGSIEQNSILVYSFVIPRIHLPQTPLNDTELPPPPA